MGDNVKNCQEMVMHCKIGKDFDLKIKSDRLLVVKVYYLLLPCITRQIDVLTEARVEIARKTLQEPTSFVDKSCGRI